MTMKGYRDAPPEPPPPKKSSDYVLFGMLLGQLLVNICWNAAWVLAFWHDGVSRGGVWTPPTSTDHASLVFSAVGRVVGLTLLTMALTPFVLREMRKP